QMQATRPPSIQDALSEGRIIIGVSSPGTRTKTGSRHGVCRPGSRSMQRPCRTLRLVDFARLAGEGLDLANLPLTEVEITRADDPLHLTAVAPADDGAGDRRVAQCPGDRDLPGGAVVAVADPREDAGQREVPRQPRLPVF